MQSINLKNKNHLPFACPPSGVAICYLLSFLLALITYHLSPITIHAQEFKLFPEKDAYVDSAYPEKNFGKSNKFHVAFTHSSKITFLKFNLDNVSKESRPQKATLNLWLDQSLGELKPVKTEVLLPSKNWSEEELNWNNKPSLYKTDLTVSLEATPGAQAIDVTPLVNQWLEGSVKNYGLAFYQRGDNFERIFFSKESNNNPPTLTFSWDQEAPAIGGINIKQPINPDPEPLEAFSLEGEVKQATDEATPSAKTTEEKQEEETNESSSINNRPSFMNLINSKNIVILGLGLLALLTVAGEKVIKTFKKE